VSTDERCRFWFTDLHSGSEALGGARERKRTDAIGVRCGPNGWIWLPTWSDVCRVPLPSHFYTTRVMRVGVVVVVGMTQFFRNRHHADVCGKG
jgi:hypothetical protein